MEQATPACGRGLFHFFSMLDTFYSTGAQICFALLGLWWVVVQFKYDEFIRDPGRRRAAYNISLYFVLPGVMCLFSLLASELNILWRVAFILAGVIGLIETAMMLRARGQAPQPGFAGAGRAAALALYVLIVLAAVFTDALKSVGITPLLVEAILLSLLVLLGVQLAWMFFVEARAS